MYKNVVFSTQELEINIYEQNLLEQIDSLFIFVK